VNKILSTLIGIIAAILAGYGLVQILGASVITFMIATAVAIVAGWISMKLADNMLGVLDNREAVQELSQLKRLEFKHLEGRTDINLNEFSAEIRGAQSKLAAIREASTRLVDTDLKYKVLGVVSVGNGIIEEIVNDPKDFRIARSWFNVHLDQAQSIVGKFVELQHTGYTSNQYQARTAERIRLDEDFGKTVDTMYVSFNNLLTDIRSNDVRALAIDMEVLNDQLKLEQR